MKIRKGFVSNSSSTSFVICFKDLKILKQDLKDLLRLNDNFDPYDFIVDFILKDGNEVTKENFKDYYKSEYFEKMGFDIIKMIDSGFEIIECESNDWVEGLKSIIARNNVDLDIETKNTIIKQIWEN